MTATPKKPSPEAPPPGDWRRLHLWQIQPVRDVLVGAVLFGILWLGNLLSVVTVPMLIALALAYLFEPLVSRVTRTRKFSRNGAALAIVVLAGLLVVLPVTIGAVFGVIQGVSYAQELAGNTEALVKSVESPNDAELRAALRGPAWQKIRDFLVREAEKARAYRSWQESQRGSKAEGTRSDGAGSEGSTSEEGPAPGVAPAEQPGPSSTPASPPTPPAGHEEADTHAKEPVVIADGELVEPSLTYRVVEWAVGWVRTNAGTIGKQALAGGAGAVAAVMATVTSVGKLLFGGFLTAFFFFFFCTGWGRVEAFAAKLIPHGGKHRVLDLVRKMDRVISAFIRGRLIICFFQMVYFTIAFTLIGVPAALVVGPIIGLLTLLPYVSGVIGIPIVILLMWLDPAAGFRSAWWWILGAPLFVQTLSQVMDDYVLTPRIQGKATGMDTPTILFASIAGASLAGMYGLLLAIPVAACIKILLQEVFWPRFRAWAEGKARDFLPIDQAP